MKFILTALAFLGFGVAAAQADDDYATAAAKMMKTHKVGMVATIQNDAPFLSVMPFSLTEKGHPVVLISDLAVHTANIKKNGKASLLVQQPDKEGNVFNGARVTLVGEFKKADDAQRRALRAVYLRRHPDAALFVDFGDFNFYVLEVKKVFFIGGFGEIGWVDLDDYEKAQ